MLNIDLLKKPFCSTLEQGSFPPDAHVILILSSISHLFNDLKVILNRCSKQQHKCQKTCRLHLGNVWDQFFRYLIKNKHIIPHGSFI